MIRKNIITDEEGHEIYEQALLMLETSQGVCSSPEVFEAARELIEQHLRKFPHHHELWATVTSGPARSCDRHRTSPDFEIVDTLVVAAQSGHRHRQAAEQVLQ